MGNIQVELEQVKNLSTKLNILAIGEVGMDPFSDSPLETQQYIFIKHLEIAKEAKKSVSVHCVRSYDKVIELQQKHAPDTVLIFHGFNRNHNLAYKIIQLGHGISLDPNFLMHPKRSSEFFQSLNNKHIYLETDDKNHSIESLYVKLALHYSMPIPVLKELIYSNFKSLFIQNS